MLILNFNLGAHTCRIFQKVFYLIFFFLNRARQILDLFVHLASLPSLLLDFNLKLID